MGPNLTIPSWDAVVAALLDSLRGVLGSSTVAGRLWVAALILAALLVGAFVALPVTRHLGTADDPILTEDDRASERGE